MPGLVQNEINGRGSPTKRKRLSLKFFQKKEAKRALDFTEKQENEQSPSEPKKLDKCDKVVFGVPLISSAVGYEKREELLPFVGLNNLGNTCYLNSVLQVLYYCPGFKTGMKFMYDIISKKYEILKSEEEPKKVQDILNGQEELPICLELICNLHGLIVSMEQIQASYLLNAENCPEGELATQPKRLMSTLKELNPMYDGYLQHDAQEVLQCILGYILEACQLLRKSASVEENVDPETTVENKMNRPTEITCSNNLIIGNDAVQEDHEMPDLEKEEMLKKRKNGKRKSDTQAGNAMKKSKLPKDVRKAEEKRQTRRTRKPSGEAIEQEPDIDARSVSENGIVHSVAHKKTELGLRWLKPTVKQPSILSKFCSLGKRTSNQGIKEPRKGEEANGNQPQCTETSNENGSIEQYYSASGCKAHCATETPNKKNGSVSETEDKSTRKAELSGFELMDGMFQGQLVLRTRCLECECYSERRENFQDISVPVQENDPKEGDGSEISPEPKMEIKTLKWAISQFASVERIVGEDKYFCENCHHYTEAERSLLFDKMPEVVTIHLKCFAACSSELEPYGNLSKVNTPLLTPLQLSLEEWSTKETSDCYELFAVVMHNGMSISSGHYTAYVKMTHFSSQEMPKEESTMNCTYGVKQEPLSEEAKSSICSQEYDDGEISVKLKGNFQTATNGKTTKKNAESVGLLGGQKSMSSFDLYVPKTKNDTEKPGTRLKENAKSDNFKEKHINSIKDQSCCNNQQAVSETGSNIPENQVSQSCCNLLEYEGKWMLFDDAEVKLTDEQDFLSSLSPSTSCTSTPYLLFYKKMANP
ncbi:ubiquitin carboxyl-terminal hydrolase 1 [Carcharodon carcharias]|uniref:ubiquitin carboxyl-terminal hydrolase 1 n=1 Tax=Carcharodon carcharias TaxID=13397 RepID=UPI001B7EA690|nr:ubiquitin carboxyl-terminal hydrolase 1 [Carcharodon carcharias]XP_041064264.1 ubiquitin carboxyl-terminal hydrolase 1 [Carcharodon carcharias]XP_041064265.1 ubiquitin carboxyl-terminal hydrolase 1 [Carcharodon carcharias]XP_041064266.1 ubiquitin carboxyl-terminal hydrolase 1 [Carcharodon carcharias]